MAKTLLYSAHTVERKLPLNYQKTDFSAFKSDLNHYISACYLLDLKNIYVTTDGVAFDAMGNTIKESGFSEIFNWRYKLSYLIKKKKITLPNKETYLFAFDNWHKGYFHWMTDTIPRILSIKNTIQDTILLLPNNVSAFQLQSLALFKFKDIYIIPENTYIKIPKMLLSTHTAPTGNYNEFLIQKMRELYTAFYSDKNPLNLGEKIYVSRVKAPKRYVNNEAELEELLRKYDFKIIYFEDYSFEEQVSIASHTKYLISIHGAGLTNMLFMPSQSYVLEFRKENDKTNLCYFSLASALNIHYLYQFGSITNEKSNTFDADIKINKEILEENIKIMLNITT